jgi:apolipoprotein N-acyltransferase
MTPFIITILSGALMVFAYAPFDAWAVAPLSLALTFRQWQKRPDKSFQLGWLFGAGWFGAGISWVHVSIAEHGGLPLIASLGLMLLLCGYLASFPALTLWLCHKFIKRTAWPLALPFLWLVLEWCRAHFLTGFPWLSIGYSQLYSPLQGWLPVIGEIGVSALLILITVSVGQNLRLYKLSSTWHLSGSKSLFILAIAMISGLVLNQHEWTTPSGETTQVTMVQGNIAQTMRWVPEQDRPTMNKYRDLSAEHWTSDIVIWPEAAIPKLEIASKGFLSELDDKASNTNTALITGIVDYNYETEKVYNSLLAIGNDQSNENTIPYRYGHNNRFSKHHLLPIGEFVPFESVLREIAPIFDLPMSSFTRGDFVQRNLLANGTYLAPAICFEIAFPSQIAANLTDQTDAIITVSNDAWFGNSHGPHQHLEIAQMRAKEFGLPVLRATNNGVTAFINHRGEIAKKAEQFAATTVTESVSFVSGKTPYRMFGNIPSYLLFGLLFVSGLLLQRKNTRK